MMSSPLISNSHMPVDRASLMNVQSGTNAVLADNFVHSCSEIAGGKSPKSGKEEDNGRDNDSRTE